MLVISDERKASLLSVIPQADKKALFKAIKALNPSDPYRGEFSRMILSSNFLLHHYFIRIPERSWTDAAGCKSDKKISIENHQLLEEVLQFARKVGKEQAQKNTSGYRATLAAAKSHHLADVSPSKLTK